MFSQASAFLTRSIRQESRLLSHHLVRGGMVLLMLYLLGLQVIQSPRLGAAGLTLMSNVMQCCYWCLTLLGVMYFSVAITEEKEEETLPLLRMTGVQNFTLLLGKSLPRLAVVVLLILISAPFLMLAVTLGGVVTEQIVASLLGLICYALCLSQLGLFASTICRNSSRATSLATVLWLLLEFGSWPFALLGIAFKEWRLIGLSEDFEWIAGWLWERTMWNATGAVLVFEQGESPWHPQATFHLVVGIVFFFASLALFERFNERAIALGSSASIPVTRHFLQGTQSRRAGRCWNAAMEWKSWFFVGGGWFWFWAWTIGLPVFSISVILVISVLVGDVAPVEVFGVSMMMNGCAAFAILSARLFGNMLNRETYEQTLVSLCMLPMQRKVVLQRMALGLLPFAVPPLFCVGLGCFWMFVFANQFTRDAADLLDEPWFWASLSWVFVAIHVGSLLSVYFRHGGMLIAAAICFFILPFMGGMLLSAFSALTRFGGGFDIIFRYMVPMFLIPVHFVACVVLQKSILHRVELLASR